MQIAVGGGAARLVGSSVARHCMLVAFLVVSYSAART